MPGPESSTTDNKTWPLEACQNVPQIVQATQTEQGTPQGDQGSRTAAGSGIGGNDIPGYAIARPRHQPSTPPAITGVVPATFQGPPAPPVMMMAPPPILMGGQCIPNYGNYGNYGNGTLGNGSSNYGNGMPGNVQFGNVQFGNYGNGDGGSAAARLSERFIAQFGSKQHGGFQATATVPMMSPGTPNVPQKLPAPPMGPPPAHLAHLNMQQAKTHPPTPLHDNNEQVSQQPAPPKAPYQGHLGNRFGPY